MGMVNFQNLNELNEKLTSNPNFSLRIYLASPLMSSNESRFKWNEKYGLM